MGKRIIVYGDIHGCLDELKALRKKIKPTSKDIEITVGDFINKGPFSHKTIQYLIHHDIRSVMGNNEAKMVKLYKKYQKNGTVFLDTLRDAEKKTLLDLQEEDITYLQTLPYFLKIDALTIVHGGIPQGISLSKKLNDKDQKLLTQLRFYNKKYEPIPYDDIESRAKFWSEVYNGSDGFVVFGHHPFEQVKVEKHALGIDTGCVYGGTLTAVTFNYHDKKVQTGAYKLYRVKAEHNHFATFM